jgi:hypothetical protein
MRPVQPDDSLDGPEFPAATVIRDALHVAAATDKPIRVIDGGQLLGVVDRAQILEAVAGAQDAQPAATRVDASRPRYEAPRERVTPIRKPTEATTEYLADAVAEQTDPPDSR